MVYCDLVSGACDCRLGVIMLPLDELQRCYTAEALLERHSDDINQLYLLTGLSSKQFDLACRPLLASFAYYVQQIPTLSRQNTLFQQRLGWAIKALRTRHAYLLPKGAKPETIAEEADIWTFLMVYLALGYRLSEYLQFHEITLWNKHELVGTWVPWSHALGAAQCGYYRVSARTIERPTVVQPCLWTLIIARKLANDAVLNWLWRTPSVFAVLLQALREPKIPESIDFLQVVFQENQRHDGDKNGA